MRDHFSDTNKIGLWFFPLNFRYVEKIFEGFKKKKTSRWCWNCRIYIIRVILKPGYGWLGMNKSCFVLSWNFWWAFWSNIFLDFFFHFNQFRLVSKHIMLLWFWIHECAYLFTFWNSFWLTFWNSFWPMSTILYSFDFSDNISIWVHLHSQMLNFFYHHNGW